MKKTFFAVAIVLLSLIATQSKSQNYYFGITAMNEKVSSITIHEFNITGTCTQSGGSTAPVNFTNDLPDIDLPVGYGAVQYYCGYYDRASAFHLLSINTGSSSYMTIENSGGVSQTVTPHSTVGGSTTNTGSGVSIPAYTTSTVTIPQSSRSFNSLIIDDGFGYPPGNIVSVWID
jgi:hypothetical protein